MISISLSPNIEKDDWQRAGKLIFQPWQWKKGEWLKKLKKLIAEYFQSESERVFLLNSGRSSLLTILKSLNLPAGSQVLLQAFTCNAAVNPILWAGLKPVFIDINQNDFNLSSDDLKKKISSAKNPRVLMVQHTFGLPTEMNEILSIARNHNLILIEDCAHSLGAEYQGKKIGTFGDFAFFSFGRDKIISSVYGGAVLINSKKYLDDFRREYRKIKFPSHYWIFQQLFHPLAIKFFVWPLYYWQVGKIILVIFQKLRLLSMAVEKKERFGNKPRYFPARLPNALAELAFFQWKKLEKFNQHRRQITKFYYQNLKNIPKIKLPKVLPASEPSFLRYPILTKKAQSIWQLAKRKGILLGDWYWSPIIPPGTDLKKMNYQLGSCPIAEKCCRETLNLPTQINIGEKEARKIIKIIKSSNY